MTENHSFDTCSAPRDDADGLSFDEDGNATNTNPGTAQTPTEVTAFPFPDTKQATHVSQSWKATHQQIDGGKMDGASPP